MLNSLPTAADAPFNAYHRQHNLTCLPDTRVDFLQDIYSWADGQNERCILWLNGLAGTGKSTIARTVARKYFDQKRLGASFFFSRGGGDVGHAGKFVTSIAWQLADNIPSLHQNICDAIKERRHIASQSLRDQWQQLVLRPLSKLSENGGTSSYVLVVDALDECDNDDNIRIIIHLLAEARSLKMVRLRVFLTSRPEIPIRYGFGQMLDAEHMDFILHNISPSIIDHDISVFFKYNLKLIGEENSLDACWPDEEVIKSLVLKAGGLFIWAATACRFIREGSFANERLQTILRGATSSLNDHVHEICTTSFQEIIRSLVWTTGFLFTWAVIACGFTREGLRMQEWLHTLFEGDNVTPEQHLDKIYITVLHNSIQANYTARERRVFSRELKNTLGSIAILLSPLSVTSLSTLLNRTEISSTLRKLHAVLDIPKDQTQPLRLHHPSFRDFLLNKDRCKDPNFWVDEKQAHQVLADSCIQLMSTSLKQDVCGVNAPNMLAADAERDWIERGLPPEVQYACRYWIDHVQKGGTQLCDNGQVHCFLQGHFLHWLEALGWMGKISDSVHAIAALESLVSVSISPA